MRSKRNIQPKTQDGKSIDHLIVSLIFRKTVLLQQECGNLAVLTLSSTWPSLIGGICIAALGTWKSHCFDLVIDIAVIDRVDDDNSSNVTPKQVLGKPFTLSPSLMLLVISTMPPSSNKFLHTFHKLPTNGPKSSVTIGIKK